MGGCAQGTAHIVDTQEQDLAEAFRRRALATGVMVGAIALGGIQVLRLDDARLFSRLVGLALPLIVASAVLGMASLGLLWQRRYVAVRVTAALAVTAVLWGWAVGQYPNLLGTTLPLSEGASPTAILEPLIVVLSAGIIVVVPSLVLLYSLFQQKGTDDHRVAEDSTEGVPLTPYHRP
jgi:cytochrome d ubiquinol oxidase subunit II